MTKEEALEHLEKSSFRAKFKLNQDDIDYINKKGINLIKLHARQFVREKLAPDFIPNEGTQTPMKGHPVFKAMHATACCCRKCLKIWYGVPTGRRLTEVEQIKIVNLIMFWINKEIEKFSL